MLRGLSIHTLSYGRTFLGGMRRGLVEMTAEDSMLSLGD